MRILFGFGLLAVSTALSGCVSNTLDSLASLSTGCTTSSTSVSCPSAPVTGGGSTGGGATGGGTTPPIVNTGNTAGLNARVYDTTIALESNKSISTVGNPAVSKLIDSPLNHVISNQTADQQIWFDTKTASNGSWPVSKTQFYDPYGTALGSAAMTGIAPDGLNPVIAGYGGNYKYYGHYEKDVVDEELQIWTWGNSYTTQYRDVTASGTAPQHQAWSFGGNYTPATMIPTGAVPTTIYTGKFTATASSSNWVDNPKAILSAATPLGGKDLAYNNTWRVLGNATITADWANAHMTGTLVPKFWQGNNAAGGFTTVDVDQAKQDDLACYNLAGICNPTANPATAGQHYTNWQDYIGGAPRYGNGGFMDTNVLLDGKITTDAANTKKPNQVAGTAKLDPAMGWYTSANTNPMYAGFFGDPSTAPTEVAGAFAVDGTTKAPVDGIFGINNDRRAFLQMSGIFHGQ